MSSETLEPRPEEAANVAPESGALQRDQVEYRGPFKDPTKLPVEESVRPPPESLVTLFDRAVEARLLQEEGSPNDVTQNTVSPGEEIATNEARLEQQRARKREYQRQRYQTDPDYREQRKASILRYQHKPDVRERDRARRQAYEQQPEVKARRAALALERYHRKKRMTAGVEPENSDETAHQSPVPGAME